VGFARAILERATAAPDGIRGTGVDLAGTGGSGMERFNVSTAAALTAAAAGVRVAKHGNRSFTSQSGSADVLEALGVRIELTPDEMGRVLAETGIVFMFAPLLHPAMRHVGPVRVELAVPTIMNLLGPLTNPAGVTRQLVGVSDPAWRELIASALRELGHQRALVVHGEPGMDELSPAGTTTVSDLRGGRITTYSVIPADLGLEPGGLEALAGGTPQENATLIVDVLEGRRRGSARSFVLANAGDVAAIRIEPGEVLWRREVGILHPGDGIPPRPPDGSSFSAAELMRSFRPE